MLRGGQNECISGDPVFLPRISHILDQMHAGGHSLRSSGCLPTHPDDQPFLGPPHPISGILLEHAGSPMGGANSPAIACRHRLSFVCVLKERFEAFRGDPKVNCWWTGISEDGYDPGSGHGFNLIGKDGGAVKILAFVDDFLIHRPTLQPDRQGWWSSQNPLPKRERASAVVEHLLESPKPRAHSRLSLAVAAGVLQSHPGLSGAHPLAAVPFLGAPSWPGQRPSPCLTACPITDEVRQDLRSWRQFLLHDKDRFARSEFSATLVPMWGDGSGAGTGGTFVVPCGPLKMCKGRWSPFVFKFSYNWKELLTLKLSLLPVREDDAEAVRGATIFYFADNSTSHWIFFYFADNSTSHWIAASGSSASPGLHKLIEEIRLLELELDCSLQAIHVPGLIMTDQGTDGLNRGIWMSALQGLADSGLLAQPLHFDRLLAESSVNSCHLARWHVCCDWNTPWDARVCFDRLSVWFPPPELARQVLIFMLETWAEKPLTSSSLFFIPRAVPAFWWGLSRHLIELPTVCPHLTPLQCPSMIPVPIVVLHLPPHQRPLCTEDGLACSAVPANAFWHRQQAALLRVIQCSFSDEGFPFADGSPACPCCSAHHTGCFAVGPPFVSRRKNGSGLTFPKVKTWPNFICKACAARAVVDRDLTGPSDWKSLCLESMRILDMVHFWALGTHGKYQGKLMATSRFEAEHDLFQKMLRRTVLLCPPVGAYIGLMWMMESHSLRASPLRGTDEMQLLSDAAVRQLRSARSQCLAWDSMVSKPDGAYFDQQRRLICQPCRPADGHGCSLFA
jgi:hypothetical protein